MTQSLFSFDQSTYQQSTITALLTYLLTYLNRVPNSGRFSQNFLKRFQDGARHIVRARRQTKKLAEFRMFFNSVCFSILNWKCTLHEFTMQVFRIRRQLLSYSYIEIYKLVKFDNIQEVHWTNLKPAESCLTLLRRIPIPRKVFFGQNGVLKRFWRLQRSRKSLVLVQDHFALTAIAVRWDNHRIGTFSRDKKS